MKNKYLLEIEDELSILKNKLNQHPIYRKIKTIEGLRVFMEHHVYASWDSMSLLKNLQKSLSNNTIYWVNSKHKIATRYINELMLEEESDLDPDGNPISHFELYLESMEEVGANTDDIKKFINAINTGNGINFAIRKTQLPKHISDFLNTTFDIIKSDSGPKVASSIYFARENLIPVIFPGFIESLKDIDIDKFKLFKFYLDRHIFLDSGTHSDWSRETLISICGNNKEKWSDARKSALDSVYARIKLWDGINDAIDD
ncbi:DUF3050 domain-containing protein [Pontimicrobium sp. MEBiC06410]